MPFIPDILSAFASIATIGVAYLTVQSIRDKGKKSDDADDSNTES